MLELPSNALRGWARAKIFVTLPENVYKYVGWAKAEIENDSDWWRNSENFNLKLRFYLIYCFFGILL